MTTIIRTPVPKSGKRKFRNAEAAARARADATAEAAMLARYAPAKRAARRSPRGYATPLADPTREVLARHAARLPAPAGNRPDPIPEAKPFTVKPSVYTGTEVKAVILHHKSAYGPVMRDNPEYAIEVTKMRR